jgi:hypothetical protein
MYIHYCQGTWVYYNIILYVPGIHFKYEQLESSTNQPHVLWKSRAEADPLEAVVEEYGEHMEVDDQWDTCTVGSFVVQQGVLAMDDYDTEGIARREKNAINDSAVVITPLLETKGPYYSNCCIIIMHSKLKYGGPENVYIP